MHYFCHCCEKPKYLCAEMPFKSDEKSGKVGRTFPDFDCKRVKLADEKFGNPERVGRMASLSVSLPQAYL